VGKALGGGVVPVSAAIANRKTFSVFDKDPYIHTGTFTGAPILMAAVQGAIQAVREDALVSRAAELGGRLLPELRRIAATNCPDLVAEVRGQGLLIGIEMIEAGIAGELLLELFNHGVVANHSMNGSSVARFTPPAVMTESDVAFLLDAFDKATKDLDAERARMPQEGGF
jgi:putrescine aminotransferase